MFNNHLYEEVILTMGIKKSGVMKETPFCTYLLSIAIFMYNFFEFVRDETVIVYKGDNLYCSIALIDHHTLLKELLL